MDVRQERRNEDRAVVALVDDDPLYVEYASELLTNGGFPHVVPVVADPRIADRIADVRADCFVIDNDLGGDNGMNVAERLVHARADRPALVMMTGTGSESTVMKAMRVGFDDYVTKRSLTPDGLASAVRRALERRSARSEPVAPTVSHDGDGGPGDVPPILDRFCREDRRRPFQAGIVSVHEIGRLRSEFGIAAARRVSADLLIALRRSRGVAGHVGRWDEDAFAWVADDVVEPAAFRACVERMADDIAVDVTLDGSWLRATPAIGAILLPAGRHDPDDVRRSLQGLHSEATRTAARVAVEVRGRSAPDASRPVEANTERRRHRRRKCLRSARMFPDGGTTVADCTVVNESDGGACLRSNSYFVAPPTFRLEVIGSGTRRVVRTRWQRGHSIGVEYVGEDRA